jgi:hypothetical protein
MGLGYRFMRFVRFRVEVSVRVRVSVRAPGETRERIVR